jgi:hypothetical protein
MKHFPIFAIAVTLLVIQSNSVANIVSVTETNLGADSPAIIVNNGFAEDALTFSDRTHNHNGAAFDANTGLLSTTGSVIVPLPGYLLGADYVRFANNARDNANYSAVVNADTQSTWYLLLDNRINGPASNTSSPNNTDPVLGGTFQWVIDGGWTRVNTGISPNGQADYTGVDESGGGHGVGPGVSLNQFYSVWTKTATSVSVTVSNNGVGASNMISLAAVEDLAVPEPTTVSLGLLSIGAIALRRRRS